MNEFNPYQNPYIQNPYQQYIPQQVMPQRNIQQTIPGKVVESFDVFRAIDIPFDGNTYYFPKADGTELYTKRWLQNGTTEQLVYKLVKPEEKEQNNPVIDLLNSIDERISKLEKVIIKPQAKVKKEEVNE